MKDKKSVAIYFLIEIIFMLISSLYMYLLTTNYTAMTMYDTKLLSIGIVILLMLIWISGPMLNRYFSFIYLLLYTLYLVSQKIYNVAFHTHYRLSMAISLRNEVAGVGDSIAEFLKFEYFIPFILLIIITVIFIILFFLFQRNILSLKSRITYRLVGLCLFMPAYAFSKDYNNMVEDVKNNTDFFSQKTGEYNLYLTISNSNLFVDKFGLLPFFYRDMQSFFEKQVFSREDIAQIDEFMNNRPTKTKNDMTGIFEGKNVLFVQAESFMDVAVIEELTPNLYKMKEEGINVVGFDTPATPGSTSDSEFAANTSLIPNSSKQVGCYLYEDNTFPTTLPKLFKENGYFSSIYHNSFGEFYNRNKFLEKLGYDSFMYNTQLGANKDLADTEVADTLSWIVNADYKYMGYWITYSGHQPYNLEHVGVNPDDVKKIKEMYPDLDDSYVSYLAKNMDLDHALGKILNVLEMTNTLDNTVIVLFGDHVVKGLDFNKDSDFYKQTGLEYNKDDIYTSLYFYNSQTEGIKYKKVGTLVDLLPTVANMWNFDYDEKTILGRDLFDSDYHGFRYAEWGDWSTDSCYYDLLSDSYTMKPDSTISLEEAKKEMAYYLKMKEISNKLLDLDYFK